MLGFLPRDEKWIREHPVIKMSNTVLGKGCVGEVHNIIGTKRLVVKVTRDYSTAKNKAFAVRELKKESSDYNKWKLNERPVFIPTKIIHFDKRLGLIRPVVHVIAVYGHRASGTPSNLDKMIVKHKELITDAMLHKLHDNLVKLSEEGFVFQDGLQLGVDAANRILVYDSGFLIRDKKGSLRAYETNNHYWKEFIRAFPNGIKVFGEIKK